MRKVVLNVYEIYEICQRGPTDKHVLFCGTDLRNSFDEIKAHVDV